MNGNQNQYMNNTQINDDRLVIPQNNTYISNNTPENNTEIYANTPKPTVDYSQDPRVQENLQKKKNNTITISADGKVLILIAIIILLFIYFLPIIYNYLN